MYSSFSSPISICYEYLVLCSISFIDSFENSFSFYVCLPHAEQCAAQCVYGFDLKSSNAKERTTPSSCCVFFSSFFFLIHFSLYICNHQSRCYRMFIAHGFDSNSVRRPSYRPINSYTSLLNVHKGPEKKTFAMWFAVVVTFIFFNHFIQNSKWNEKLIHDGIVHR